MKPIHLTPLQRPEIQGRCKQTLDKRIYQRLTAVLLIADGKPRYEVAQILQISLRQLSDWLGRFRNQGLDALCTLHYKGGPGKLTAQQVEQLKQEIGTGRFRNSDQIRLWLEDTFRIPYTPSGVKELLRRLGVSYHKATGFLWKADPEEQQQFVEKYRQQRGAARRPGAR